MAKKIILAEYDLNIDKVFNKAAELKQQISVLEIQVNNSKKSFKDVTNSVFILAKAQEQLRKEGKTDTVEYKKNQVEVERLAKKHALLSGSVTESEKELKKLRGEYNLNQKAVIGLEKSQAKLINGYTVEQKSISELKDDYKQLRVARDQSNDPKTIQRYNELLDENINKQRSLGNSEDKRVLNIGNYKDAVASALAETKVAFSEGGFSAGFKVLNDKILDISTSLKDLKPNVESVNSSNLDGLGGTLNNLKGGFVSLIGSVRAFTVSLLSNPLTAIVVGVTALVGGIALFTKELFAYNTEIKESVILTEQITRATGVGADEIRNRATALSKSFGGEFKENLLLAKQLVEAFGVSYEEAFDTIENGLLRGGQANTQFADSILEYEEFFARAGFSASEFIGVINAGFDLGIYNDKLPDAIKEFDLSLREQTKASREALIFAFGEPFTNDILNRINTGATSTKQALQEIAKESKKTQLSTQQQAKLTADLFRGAGEDAGGFLNVIKAINKAEQDALLPLTELQQQTLALSEANEDLQISRDRAFKSDTIIGFQKAFEVFGIKAKTVFFDFISGVTNIVKAIDDVTGISDVFITTFKSIFSISSSISRLFSSLFGIIGTLGKAFGISGNSAKGLLRTFFELINPINALNKGFQLISDGLQKVVSFADRVSVSFTGLISTVRTVFNTISNAVSDFDLSDPIKSFQQLKTVSDINISDIFKESTAAATEQLKVNREITAENEKQIAIEEDKQEALRLQNEERNNIKSNIIDEQLQNKENIRLAKIENEERAKLGLPTKGSASIDARTTTSSITTAERKVTTAESNIQETVQDEIKLLQEVSEKKQQIAELELTKFIANNETKIAENQRLNDAIIEQEGARLDIIESKELILLKTETQNEISKAETSINNKELLALELERIDLESSERALSITSATIEKKNALEKANIEQLEQERVQLQAIGFATELQSLQEDNATKFELQRELAEQKNIIENEDLQIKRDAGLISQQVFDQQTQLQSKKHESTLTKIKQIETNQRLNATKSTLGQVAKLLGENTAAGKAAGIAQATINTYQGVTEVWKAPSVLPEPFNTTSKIIGTATTLASGLAAVKQITSVKAQRGMIIQGNSHANGGVPISMARGGSIEAEGGEAIINKKSTAKFRGVLSAINQSGGGVKFASGGVIGSRLQNVQNTINSNLSNLNQSDIIRDAVMEGSMLGTLEGTSNGIVESNIDNDIENNANF